MDLTMMRRIDVWVGVPLCYSLTLLNKIGSIFRRSLPQNKKLGKVLIIKLSEMGAITLTYPMLEHLSKEHPGISISFLAFEKNASALRLLNNRIPPENIITIKDDGLIPFITSSFSALGRIRRERFDAVIDLEFFARFTAVFTYLTGAPKRAGFYRYRFEGLYRGELLTHKVQYNSLIHCCRSYLVLGKALSSPRKDTPQFTDPIKKEELIFPSLPPDAQDIAQVRERLNSLGLGNKKIFLTNPGDGVLPPREWPIEKYTELVKRLLEDPQNIVLIIGRDCITNKDIALEKAVSHPRCVNLVNKTSFKELMALFNIAEKLITNDCGLPHLASLTKIRKVVIFGPESPAVFAPVGENTTIVYSDHPCSPCISALNHRDSTCDNNYCLQSISVDQVYSLLK